MDTPAFPTAIEPREGAAWPLEAREAFHRLFRHARHYEAVHTTGAANRYIADVVFQEIEWLATGGMGGLRLKSVSDIHAECCHETGLCPG